MYLKADQIVSRKSNRLALVLSLNTVFTCTVLLSNNNTVKVSSARKIDYKKTNVLLFCVKIQKKYKLPSVFVYLLYYSYYRISQHILLGFHTTKCTISVWINSSVLKMLYTLVCAYCIYFLSFFHYFFNCFSTWLWCTHNLLLYVSFLFSLLY